MTKASSASEVLLRANKVTKKFGGLTAVNEVSVNLSKGQIHAVIGPNGAGKSTLANLLSGDLPPTSGHVSLNGQDITGWTPEKISRHGLGRSYQKTNIFRSFSVWDNVRLSAQSRSQPGPFMAGAASHGEQRQLEIAMTLATEPQVLLLDEPLAGMGQAEAESMVQLLLRLKASHAMMLVEHDMDAVFALADQLTVMVNGQVIASGLPAAVRADTSVQAAYLGEDH